MDNLKNLPPKWADKLLVVFLPDDLAEELQGDMHEQFEVQVEEVGLTKAKLLYVWEVLRFCRPYFLKRRLSAQADTMNDYSSLINPVMLRNYLKIAWRNLFKHKGYSAINIVGLAIGMTVTILIGLWLHDELTFDQYHKNYDRIAQVMQNQTNNNGQISTNRAVPAVLGEELRQVYGSDFSHVLMASWNTNRVLTYGDMKLRKRGTYIEPDAPEVFGLKMLRGTHTGLTDPHSILLSESVAKVYFGDENPLGKFMKIDARHDVKVTGVYEDLPNNSTFTDISFFAPWKLFYDSEKWISQMNSPWNSSTVMTYVQLADKVDLVRVSAKIKNVKRNHVDDPEVAQSKPELFLHPMSDWHLRSNFENGISHGGKINQLWVVSMIGIFVLLLACINFMNLSTARTEKRAKEVGIRKAIGSIRGQLIIQFISESVLVTIIAFVIAILTAYLLLPVFNEIADKKLTLLWTNPVFWGLGIGFAIFTGLLAGSYPAFYLSSFQPIKVLKGTFKTGRLASIPRKILVVSQFTVSITLIVGAWGIYRQIQYAQSRPIGYNRNDVIMMGMTMPDIHQHFGAIREELKNSGAVLDVAESGSPTTEIWYSTGGYSWKGKDPTQQAVFCSIDVTPDFGKTIGWQMREGRDFVNNSRADSSGMIFNEAAIRQMGMQNPIGQQVTWNDKTYTIIGVIKDMVMESPFEPVRPTSFFLDKNAGNVLNIKLNPVFDREKSLQKVEQILKKYSPNAPFEYQFIEEAYSKKFGSTQQFGKLISMFTVLAIFISCLGLFGLASFIAEQRTKEIGVRKILGATVLAIWRMLSKDFALLVVLSFMIATPISHYLLSGWLTRFTYRTEVSWWIFILTGIGTLLLTILTVSYHTFRAALMNPVKSLKNE